MSAAAHFPADAPAPSWTVPVEMVLACTGSKLKKVVLERFARGDLPKDAAKVIRRGEQLFATIEFKGDRYKAVFMPLDVWTLGLKP